MTIAQALELTTSELVAGVTAAVVGGVTLVNWCLSCSLIVGTATSNGISQKSGSTSDVTQSH